MANYYASARTNYFLVKDIEAFTNEVEPISVELSTKTVDDKTFVCLLSDGEGGFPWEYYEETSDDYLEVDCYSLNADYDLKALSNFFLKYTVCKWSH